MGQTVSQLDLKTTAALLRKLQNKLSVGKLLEMKREAQGLTKVEKPEQADEVYTYEWALNPADVNSVVLGDL